MRTTPTASATTRRSSPALLAGLIDLAGPGRRPHPGGRRCDALCVPACTASSESVADDGSSAATARGGRL